MRDCGAFDTVPRVGHIGNRRLHMVCHTVDHAFVDIQQQIFLGGEVIVKRAGQHIYRCRNVAHRRAIETLPRDQFGGLVQNEFALAQTRGSGACGLCLWQS